MSLSQYLTCELKSLKNDHKKYFVLLLQFLRKFKTVKCTLPIEHSAQKCFDYHMDEQKRRDPYITHKFLYYPNVDCACNNQKCTNSHSKFQKKYHPLLYKTTKCNGYYDCPLGLVCPDTHHDDTLHFQIGEFFRFDISLFKTEQCHRKDPHERKTCLYYHNDRDKRRPTFNEYNHIPCGKQNCDWKTCEYSHNKIEQLYHPSRYKSKFCQAYPHKISQCEYRDFCSFAHTQAQITIQIINPDNKDPSYIIGTYKTVWCPLIQNHDRSNCPYAHNIQDYRRKPRDYKYLPERCEFWNFSDEIKSIEEAGCKAGMQCNKCHGWMEQRYHPAVYKKPGSHKYSNKKDDYSSDNGKTPIEKKLFNPKDAKHGGKQTKIESIAYKEIEFSNQKMPIYSVGAPFFKQEREISEASRKTTRTINIESSDKSNDDSSYKQSSNISNILSKQKEGETMNKIKEIVFEEEEVKVWGKKLPPYGGNQGKQESSRAKSQGKSDEYDLNYSNSIKQALDGQDSNLLIKLRQKRINEVNLINLDENKVKGLKFLDSKQRQTLIRKLKEYSLKRDIRPIEYSKEITKFFIKQKCQGILEKMKRKKVKEGKLISLGSKEIKELSFLQEKEKCMLPKVLKQFRSDKQFAQLFKDMNKVIQENGTGQ